MDINYVNEFLKQFGKGAQVKRIANDCKTLYTKYPNLLLSNNSGKIELIVIENEENYSFVFNNTYPFKAPQIYYNGKSYLELLKINDMDERKILRKYKNKECLCCDSYHCDDNWSPSLTLSIIVDEIKSIVQLRKTIVHILLANKIKDKYLIDDIDINSYLI
jgi:hypothetical protein